MAESVLTALLAEAGLDDRVVVDSTAISAEERGNPIDRRAARTLRDHGYPVLERHRARQLGSSTGAGIDLFVPMTAQHARAIGHLIDAGTIADAPVRMYRSFDPALGLDAGTASAWDRAWDIDDPWYGDQSDFEAALTQIEAAAAGLTAWAERRLHEADVTP